ncbi:MAG: hypothetical protein JWQ70_2247 [Aeromicrobium sp.]|nr:hypothetical protein [Aeromicrobium sp.]
MRSPEVVVRRSAVSLGLLLAGTLVLIAWGMASGSHIPARYADPQDGATDTDLYSAITDRVLDGQGYYSAVAAEQPLRGYPTQPVFTVREPTLTWLADAVGGDRGLRLVLGALTAVALALLAWQLVDLAPAMGSWLTAFGAAAFTSIAIWASGAELSHEVWAGLFLVMGVSMRRFGVIPWVLCVLFAALFRELAIAVLLLTCLESIVRGRWREVAWSVGALALFSMFYAWHAHEVNAIVAGSGTDSRGWFGWGGWPAVVDGIQFSSPLTLLPFAISAVVVPLALFGWLAQRSPTIDTAVIVLVVAIVLLGVVGRADNVYWGLMFSPLLLSGLGFVPTAVARFVRDLRSSALLRVGSV